MEPESKRAKFNSVGKIPILDETTGQIVFNDHEEDEADDNDAIVGGADDDENGSSLASLCAKSQEILNAVKHDAFDAHIDFIQMASGQSLTDHNHNNIDLSGQKKPLITSSPSSSNEAVKKSMASSRLILFDSNSNLLDEMATTTVTATTVTAKTLGKKPAILPASLVFGSTSSNSSSNISPHVSQAYSILAQEITSPMTLSPFSSLLQPPAVFTSAVSSSNSTSSSSSIQRCSHLSTNLSQQDGTTIGIKKRITRMTNTTTNGNHQKQSQITSSYNHDHAARLLVNQSFQHQHRNIDEGLDDSTLQLQLQQQQQQQQQHQQTRVPNSSARETATCQFCGRAMLKKNIPTHIRRAHTPKEELVCLNEEQNIYTFQHLKPGQRRKRSIRAYDYSQMTATVSIDEDPCEGIENKFVTEGEEISSVDLLQLADRIRYSISQIPIDTLSKLVDVLTKIELSTEGEIKSNAKFTRNMICSYLKSGEEFKYKLRLVGDEIGDKKRLVSSLRADLKEIMARKMQLERRIQPMVCDLQKLEDQHSSLMMSLFNYDFHDLTQQIDNQLLYMNETAIE